ncbi:MAG: type II transport protein [Desulfobacula sp.]|jgi:type IV fimbrial biogenesis protein FimT|nr:type II transport protein [Desulfobacula sp.]MBT7260866.1 type II transport protein [Desulfobacula sp.]
MAPIIKNKKAFSLLELLVVILIIAISITFGLPSLTEMVNNQRLKGTARDIFSIFKKAKQEAIRRNTNVVISITPASYSPDGMKGSYLVFVDDGKGTGTAENSILDGDEEILTNVSMPQKVSLISSTFTGSPKTTAFNSRGLPTKLGDVRLRNSIRWYKISLSIAGNVKMDISKDDSW